MIGKKTVILFVSVFLILFLPAAGVIFNGGDIFRYLAFPPVAGYVMHNDFSWEFFAVLACALIVVVIHPACHIIRSRNLKVNSAPLRTFPWWGYAAIGIALFSWIIAWERFPFMYNFQRWTFVPLWISYIIAINAFCVKRTQRSLLTNRTGYFLALFPVSSVFWWVFEYLNRFTANWYYTGIMEFSPARYFLEATIAFSTVLPAVMSTAELIKSFPRIYAGGDAYIKIDPGMPRLAAWMMLLFSGFGLSLTAIFPESLFPLIWISPFLIIVSLQVIFGDENFFSSVRHGDWRAVIVYALAALFCGFFWEMWNIYSQAKWIYSIPFVHRFQIFEMPLLGYAGYLPFGVQCAVVSGFFAEKGGEPWGSGYIPLSQ